MPGELSDVVRACRGRRVLVVGDLILDRYIHGDAERISPEAPVPVLRTVETREAVGGAGNVAACLAALGCAVTCCGTVGEDRHGETLGRLLSDLDADTSAVLTVRDRVTTTKTRLVGLAQHRHRQQLLRVDTEETTPLPTAEVERVAWAAARVVDDVDVVCIEDYDKGLVTETLVQGVLAEAKRTGRTVLVDPARLSDYARYRGAHVLTPNRAELALAVGRNLDTLEAVGAAAGGLRERLDFGAVVTTVDRDGAVLVQAGADPVHLPTTPRSVYDNTGAGDAVLAMLAAAVAAGADLAAATKLANLAGGLEVEKFGCIPITADEVLAELRLEHLGRNGKLRRADELAAEIAIRRDRGETVAFTNGCFDILHAGHVDLLQRCRGEASMLVVGLNTDASARALGKGDDRPINVFEHRAAVLAALACVDYVVGFDDATPEAVIRLLKPDVLIKGEDWATEGVVGADFVESTGGRVVLLPLVDGLSTTALIDRIRGATV
ncbi:MAG: PfkB family carbohydrate kinase [Phycisphaerae bacterium]